MKTGLAHVCIESRDLEATEKFYRVLGLERQFEFRNANIDQVALMFRRFMTGMKRLNMGMGVRLGI